MSDKNDDEEQQEPPAPKKTQRRGAAKKTNGAGNSAKRRRKSSNAGGTAEAVPGDDGSETAPRPREASATKKDKPNKDASRQAVNEKSADPTEPQPQSEEELSESEKSKTLGDRARGLGRFASPSRLFSGASLPKFNANDNQERLAYIGALVGGSLIIAVGKGFSLVGPWVAVSVAAVIIAAYAIYMATKREARPRLDRAGDNCYYLGLTYTLVSMFVALIQLDPGVSPAGLISAFGVALGSTIAGIIARLVLVQFKTEVDEIETVARMELAEASDRLREHLAYASSEFQQFAVGIRSSVKDSIEEITEDQLGKQKKLIEEFSHTLEKSISVIATSSSGFEEAIERQASISSKFEDAAKRSVEAASALSEKVSEIQVPSDILTTPFEDIGAEISKSKDAVQTASGEINAAAAALTKAAEQITQLASSSSGANSVIDDLSAKTTELNEHIGSLASTVENENEKFGKQSGKMQAELEGLEQISLKYARGLTEVAEFLAKEIGSHGRR